MYLDRRSLFNSSRSCHSSDVTWHGKKLIVCVAQYVAALFPVHRTKKLERLLHTNGFRKKAAQQEASDEQHKRCVISLSQYQLNKTLC